MKIKKYNIDIKPIDSCSYCGRYVDMKKIKEYEFTFFNQKHLCVTFQCPVCKNISFAKYEIDYMSDEYNQTHPYEIVGRNTTIISFSAQLNEFSPGFVQIFNDSYSAQQLGLLSICGAGYRKALEYLLKDYLIKIKKEDINKIRFEKLAKCVNMCADLFDVDVLNITRKLGNDSAHYENGNIEYDINTLNDYKDMLLKAAYKIESMFDNNFFKEKYKKYLK